MVNYKINDIIMKTTFLFIILSAITLKSFAQTDKVLARASYTYINTTDTLKNKKIRTENMVLFIGKNASLYTSKDKITYEITEDEKNTARIKEKAGMGNGGFSLTTIDRSGAVWLTKTNYTFFMKEKKMITKEEIIGLAYLIEEPIPEINWKITKDTIMFSGLACKKAIASFEGKNWTAWFAPSLPFQTGPWKLQGLPGLIVDAFDDNKDIQFQFAGFEKANEGEFVRSNDLRKGPNASPDYINRVDSYLGLDVSSAYFDNIIKLSTYRTSKTTRKEYNKLKTAFEKDPRGFSQAQSGNY